MRFASADNESLHDQISGRTLEGNVLAAVGWEGVIIGKGKVAPLEETFIPPTMHVHLTDCKMHVGETTTTI